MPRPIIALLIIAFGSGCASAHAEGSADAPVPAQTGNANTLTAEEIAKAHAITLYDAIAKLRANFLTNRGRMTINTEASALPAVYRDGSYFGTLETLKSIPAADVQLVRLYRPSEFQGRFGSDNAGGVIDVTSRKQ